MARNDTTAAIVDGILRLVALGGVTAAALVTPNALQLVDRPLGKLLERLDKDSRERELRRVIAYMKRQGLIAFGTEDYEHGVILTGAGKERLKRQSYDSLAITPPSQWDHKWRLVFFDIPEENRAARKLLTHKLRLLGFQQLQKSIWVHPFPCRLEIEAVTETLNIRRYLTYVEISQIDNHKKLIERFDSILK